MSDFLSAIGSAFRPLAKELIKGGMYLMDSVSELASEAGEQFKDLVAEAKAERAKQEGESASEQDSKDEGDKTAS